jgi:hypothetical protein
LAGVALSAFLASRSQQSHWFRDHRLEAFVAAQTVVYRVMSTAPFVIAELEPPQRLEALTSLDDAVKQWGEARGRLDLLAGPSVVSASDELHKTLADMGFAATKHVREVVKAAREKEAVVVAERSDWDKRTCEVPPRQPSWLVEDHQAD